MRISRRWASLVVVLGVCAALLAQWVLPDTPSGTGLQNIISTSLYPAFTRDGQDYALNNCAGEQVRLKFVSDGDARVTVDGKRVSEEWVSKLRVDQLLRVSARVGEQPREYFIRCLPNDFPLLRAKALGDTAEGYYFVPYFERKSASRWALGPGYYTILDERGAPLWYRRSLGSPVMMGNTAGGNMLLMAFQPGVMPTFGSREENVITEMTLAGKVVRQWSTPAYDSLDVHTFEVLPNGNLLVLTNPFLREQDVSRQVPNALAVPFGEPNNVLCGAGDMRKVNVASAGVRELTPEGEIVWSWNAHGSIPFSDAYTPTHSAYSRPNEERLCAVDMFHPNWISSTPDGEGFLISMRGAGLYRIDRATGKVRWKIGGKEGPNSLRVVGDPLGAGGPIGQHGGVLDTEGHLLIFDNRNNPEEVGRAVEYVVDEDARTATFVRAYEPPSDKCSVVDGKQSCPSDSQGNAEYLPDGGRLVSWGSKINNRNVATVFSRDGAALWVLMNNTIDHDTYRVHRVPTSTWKKEQLRAGADSLWEVPHKLSR